MRPELTPIDEESLANLSDDELAELADAWEQLHLREQRENIVSFALNTEVPGTPSPYSENDRIRMLKRKEQMRRARLSETEYEDAEDVIPETEDVIEFYPKQLEIAEHQQLILESIQALMEEEPIVGPLANGHEGVAPDGVMLMVPPGGAKSTYASVVAPAWVAGRYPGTDVITLSYGADLARRFGRRVRHICRQERYTRQFETSITSDNQAVDQWSLDNGSTYKAVGILGGVTGSRGDLVIGDDLIAGREEAESEVIRNKTWDAYKDDVLTRLKPRGKLVMIMCMTGDTPVLMEDGSEKPLRDIRPGDHVATYDDGNVSVSTVRNWISQGSDRVYEIRMKSGITVRANARHPFLTKTDGKTEWQRTATLRPGSIILRVTGANGAARSAPQTAANSRPGARAFACPTTANSAGQEAIARLLQSIRSAEELRACGIDTASAQKNMTVGLPSKVGSAPSADSRQDQAREPIGETSSASTTAMEVVKFEAYSATTATSLLVTASPKLPCSPQLSTCEIIEDEVAEIVDAGVEEVFDLEIEGTENFIANGLVSHNTRWHEDDPMGRLLGEDWEGQSGLWKGTDGRWWLVLRMPLLADRDDDPLGRARGERMWPEWFDERFVELARAQGERTWNSLYQQNPSAADGNILLKSAWRCWPHGKPEPTEEQRENPTATKPPKFGTWRQCILVYDTALKDEEQNDYSAMTAWLSFERGVTIPQRKNVSEKQQNLLMIGAWRAKIQASELLKAVLDHVDHFKPDRIVIEDKASGIQLIQELRKRRPRHEYGEVVVEAWLPGGVPGTKGKVPRAWSASLTLNEGSVWYMPGAVTEAVIKEAASFPNGRNDDWVDTVTTMILYSRKTNLLEVSADALSTEEVEEIEEAKIRALEAPRPSYGFNRSKPYSQAARGLYGRT